MISRLLILIPLILVYLTIAAQAQIRTLTVSINGLACPFCAYGVEKKLKIVEGVESIVVMMKKGTVTLTSKEGQSIDIEKVPGAIDDSGFSIREMRLRATGIIIEENGAVFLQYGDIGKRLTLKAMGSAMREKLIEFTGGGQAAMVEGTVSGKPGGIWTLTPESVEVAQ